VSPKPPMVRVRRPFSRARAVLYEDYMAIEHVHSLGIVSEESRTYYDEIRWVVKFQVRDWFRAGHAVAWSFLGVPGLLLLLLGAHWILQAIGLAFVLPAGFGLLYSVYRFIALPRTVAQALSPRGSVEIGTDWPRSGNPRKDAGVFFDAFLKRLELVAEIPQPPPPAVPAPAPAEVAAPPAAPEPPPAAPPPLPPATT
jgi:hypothetical protein